MKNGHAQTTQPAHPLLRLTSVAVLAVALTISLRQPANPADLVPPLVPPNLEVPEGNTAFLEGHAIGTQNYICLPAGSSVAWILFGPQATLFNDHERQIITHFLSPNPDEPGTARPTWQHSRDTSTVWAMAIASSTDPDFVALDAIPWLLLQVVGAEPGPTDGQRLTRTTFIQRLHTSGGIPPLNGCAQSTDVGQRALVPYTADYVFYKAATSE